LHRLDRQAVRQRETVDIGLLVPVVGQIPRLEFESDRSDLLLDVPTSNVDLGVESLTWTDCFGGQDGIDSGIPDANACKDLLHSSP